MEKQTKTEVPPTAVPLMTTWDWPQSKSVSIDFSVKIANSTALKSMFTAWYQKLFSKPFPRVQVHPVSTDRLADVSTTWLSPTWGKFHINVYTYMPAALKANEHSGP